MILIVFTFELLTYKIFNIYFSIEMAINSLSMVIIYKLFKLYVNYKTVRKLQVLVFY
jgi:hypothetical protein